ncbi:MAG: hypothetical protein M1812_000035 [Candelaria pacifica]|nr:MAG: hypothetical protein M1812_000035 [Candelaria pacifica]
MAVDLDNRPETADDAPASLDIDDFYFGDPDCEEMQNYELGGHHPVHIGDLMNNRRPTYVALKINVADLTDQSSELKVLKHLAEHPNGPGTPHLLDLLDNFMVEGPNGRHDVLVVEIVGPRLKDIRHLLTPEIIKTLVFQIVSAVACLHAHGICHGDLHTGNISTQVTGLSDQDEDSVLRHYLGYPDCTPVLTKDPNRMSDSLPRYIVRPLSFRKYVMEAAGQDKLQWNAKIMDFGEAFFRDSRPEYLSTPLVFRAPEVIFYELSKGEINKDWGYQSDIWSLGCFIFDLVFSRSLLTRDRDEADLIYEMTGTIGPLPNSWNSYWDWEDRLDAEGTNLDEGDDWWRIQLEETVKQSPITGRFPGFDEKGKSELADLLGQMLVYEPEKRKSADELLRHPWFEGCRKTIDASEDDNEAFLSTNTPPSSSCNAQARCCGYRSTQGEV